MNSAAETILQHGKYRLDRVLGRGEFGITYQATHLHVGQTVAIKTLAPNPGQPQDIPPLRHQLVAIARRWSLCQHPNLVRVLDLFEEGGYPFIVEQFVPGESLETLVRPGQPLPAPQALHYIRQIASALQVAHQQGLLHCHLRPSSVIRRAGTNLALLADFGAGSFLQPDIANRHVPNRALGGSYAAIEQYLPHEKPTPATDVYRLSATLYYLLTGEAPLEAPLCASQLTEQLLRTQKPSLRQFRRDFHPALEEAVRWGLELQSRHRPSGIAQWLEALPTAPTPDVAPPEPPPAPVPALREERSPAPPPPQPRRAKKSPQLWVAPLFVLTALTSGWGGFELTRRYGAGIAGHFDPSFSPSGDESEQLVLDPSKPIFEDPGWVGKQPDSQWNGDGEPQLLGDGSTDVGELLEDVAYESGEELPDPYDSPRAVETPGDYASDTPPDLPDSTTSDDSSWDEYPPTDPLPESGDGEEFQNYRPLDPAVPEVPDLPEVSEFDPEPPPSSESAPPEPTPRPVWEREPVETESEAPVWYPSDSQIPDESRSAQPQPEPDGKRWDEFDPSDPGESELELSEAEGESEHL